MDCFFCKFQNFNLQAILYDSAECVKSTVKDNALLNCWPYQPKNSSEISKHDESVCFEF